MKSIFLGILSLLSVQLSLAGVVPVREVRLKVFEKEVTGYRINVALAKEELRAGIQGYFAAYPLSPVRMQEGLIYENFEYPPITTARPITLYYQLTEQEGLFTELTLIGLYTYQEDINIHRFPDLSLRMLLDLSEMIQSLTGDPIDFDALFERQSVEEIRSLYQERKERNYMDFYVQREGDWIGSDKATLVKQNPFGENSPENFETEDKVVALINGRIKRYVAQNRSQSSPFLNDSSQLQFVVWRDSARYLNDQLQQLNLAQDSLIALIPDSLVAAADTIYISETMVDSSMIDAMTNTIADLDKQIQQLELKLALSHERSDLLISEARRSPKELIDSLPLPKVDTVLLTESRVDTIKLTETLIDTILLTETRVDTFRFTEVRVDTIEIPITRIDTIKMVELRIDTVEVLVAAESPEVPNIMDQSAMNMKVEAKLTQLSSRNKVLEAENAKLSGISAEYEKLNVRHEQLKDRFALRARVLEESGRKVDQLESRSIRLTQDNLALLAERDSFAQELMILNPESEAARLRREVYRRQLDQLTETQQTQTRQAQALARREKQVEQRERYLAEFEATGESQALLSRIIQLENQLKTQEQESERLRTEARQSQKDFQIERQKEALNLTTYRFKTGVNDDFAKEQVLAWFRLRGIFPSTQEPLQFDEVLIPSISNELLQLRFVSLSNGWWKLSFQAKSDEGLYLIEPSVAEVEGLLIDFFR